MAKTIYIGVFLSPSEREKLLAAIPPKFTDTHASHVTIIFRPTDEDLTTYAPAIGAQVVLQVVAEVSDDRGQAVLVEGVHSRNKHTHITIATAPGTKPVYSNELFEKCEHRKLVQPVQLIGVIDTYPSSQKIEKEIANG